VGLQGKHGTTAAPVIEKCILPAFFVSVLCAVSFGRHCVDVTENKLMSIFYDNTFMFYLRSLVAQHVSKQIYIRIGAGGGAHFYDGGGKTADIMIHCVFTIYKHNDVFFVCAAQKLTSTWPKLTNMKFRL